MPVPRSSTSRMTPLIGLSEIGVIRVQHEDRPQQGHRGEILVGIDDRCAEHVAAECLHRFDLRDQQVDAEALRQGAAEIVGRHPGCLAYASSPLVTSQIDGTAIIIGTRAGPTGTLAANACASGGCRYPRAMDSQYAVRQTVPAAVAGKCHGEAAHLRQPLLSRPAQRSFRRTASSSIPRVSCRVAWPIC